MVERNGGSGRGWLLVALIGVGVFAWFALGIVAADDVLAAPVALTTEQPQLPSPESEEAMTSEFVLSRDLPGERVDLDDEPKPGPPVPSERLWRLVQDLAHDHIRGNALSAMYDLRKAKGDAAPLLAEALYSHDRQQRQLAAYLLRESTDKPSDRLLEITVEALHTDRIPFDPEKWKVEDAGNLSPHIDNAVQGTLYLMNHIPQARKFLLQGLFSRDPQQRFLCAFLVGYAGIQEHIWRTCEILIPHLADNDMRGDAVTAAHALYRLGPPVLPYISHARARADRQALQLLNLIELDIRNPPRNSKELAARKTMQSVSDDYQDPVFQLVPRDFPSWEQGVRVRSMLPPR